MKNLLYRYLFLVLAVVNPTSGMQEDSQGEKILSTPIRIDLKGKEKKTWDMKLSPDGAKAIFLSNGSYYVDIFDCVKEAKLLPSLYYKHPLLALLSPDGEKIAICCWGKTQIREVPTEKDSFTVIAEDKGYLLAWSPCGEKVATFSLGKIHIFNAQTGESLRKLEGASTKNLFFGKWSPQGEYFACGNDNGQVIVWNENSSEIVADLKIHNHPVQSITWTQNGTQLASCSSDGSVAIWDFATRKIIRFWKLASSISESTWSPDAPHLAYCVDGGRVVIGDLSSERFKVYSGYGPISFSDNGLRFLFSPDKSDVVVVDFRSVGESGTELLPIKFEGNFEELVKQQTFSPEDESSSDETVNVDLD